MPDIGLYFYNARWFASGLGRFAQADSIIPQPGNPIAWDRYSGLLNNPIRYTDPSGHAVSAGDDGGLACNGYCYDNEAMHYWRKDNKPIKLPDPTPLKSSTWSPVHSADFALSARDSDYPETDLSPIEELLGVFRYYKTGSDIVEIVNGISNIGVPLWRRWKGSLPGGSVMEGFIGGGTQLSKDLTDRSTIRSPGEIALRMATAGVEDYLTESVSSPAGTALMEVGEACGPAAPVCMVAGYLIAANAVTWFMDNIVWQPINSSINLQR